MNNYKTLIVWQKSVDLSINVYIATSTFPSEEKYGLTNQIRRVSTSIPANIAEGAGRNSPKEFNQFLAISNGSSNELETCLIISEKLGFLNMETKEKLSNQIVEIQKMIHKLKQSLKV